MYSIEHEHPHEEGQIISQPLTINEVISLLTEARTLSARRMASPNRETRLAIIDIQRRFCQGVPGLECPQQADGPIAEKRDEICRVFVEWTDAPDTLFEDQPLTKNSDIVVTLIKLMEE